MTCSDTKNCDEPKEEENLSVSNQRGPRKNLEKVHCSFAPPAHLAAAMRGSAHKAVAAEKLQHLLCVTPQIGRSALAAGLAAPEVHMVPATPKSHHQPAVCASASQGMIHMHQTIFSAPTKDSIFQVEPKQPQGIKYHMMEST
eukprot:6462993-Amphidinium_carterae.2